MLVIYISKTEQGRLSPGSIPYPGTEGTNGEPIILQDKTWRRRDPGLGFSESLCPYSVAKHSRIDRENGEKQRLNKEDKKDQCLSLARELGEVRAAVCRTTSGTAHVT